MIKRMPNVVCMLPLIFAFLSLALANPPSNIGNIDNIPQISSKQTRDETNECIKSIKRKQLAIKVEIEKIKTIIKKKADSLQNRPQQDIP